MNLTADDAAEGIFKDRAKIGASLADIDPMTIDRSVSTTALYLSRYHSKYTDCCVYFRRFRSMVLVD